MGKTVVWLSKRMQASDRGAIGPKAGSLCTLRGLGLRVPRGFCVTTEAFRTHLKSRETETQIASLLERLDEDPDSSQSILTAIRDLMARALFEHSLHRRIAAAYVQLGATTIAVRSSATAEDLPGHSFAGQYETILGVRSLEECLDAIRRCWASLWTERAFEYRRRNGIDRRQVEMAVIVQEQIEPEAAGVAFSLDPVTGSPSRIVIESCRGLGEALVSGMVQPDRILFRKKNLALVRQNLPASESSLDLKAARKLARYVRRIEKHLGYPQDIEWAIRDGTFWFLQARPITAIPEPRPWEDRQIWVNTNLGEVVPDVMTPVTRSVIVPMFLPLFGSIFRMFGADVARSQVVGLVAGRLYFNVNTGLAAGRPFGLGPDKLAEVGKTVGGDQAAPGEPRGVDICDEDLPDLGFHWPRYILSWPAILRTLLAHRPSKSGGLPAEIDARAASMLHADAEAMETSELIRAVSRGPTECLGDWDLLYLIPGFMAVGLLQKICRSWLNDEHLALAYRLFAAQGGIADTQAGLDLWRLAELAHENIETRTVIFAGAEWHEVHRQLDRTEHGRVFLAAWDRFMAEHGHHCRGEMGLFNPRWSETPDYVLGVIRSYLGSIGRGNPLANQPRLAEERRRLTEQCRHRLRNPIKRWIFNRVLHHSQKVAVDRENWKNLGVRVFAALRRMLLVLGVRLKDLGLLNDRDDIFFLELPEVELVASRRADFEVRQRIVERRAEYEKNLNYIPPSVVVGRFDPARHVPPPVDAATKTFHGVAVSPGIVTGKARVILRTDDHQHVEVGEILVAPFTDPAWTPYFLPAAGVVVDQGGVLSHGAIIAREYGLPAVVNVGPASRMIKTGQMLRVDGDRGIVTILDER